MLEYYDFFIYGTAAALVFGKVFFPESRPRDGHAAVVRHVRRRLRRPPDRRVLHGPPRRPHGRKRVLLLTVALMGVATFLVGCLPTYDEHRPLGAGRCSSCLRLLQGFSASGEQAGANSLSLEHAPEHRRAFFTSFTLGGTQAGLIIATAVFLPIGALPEEQLLSWGWRDPVLAQRGRRRRRRCSSAAASTRRPRSSERGGAASAETACRSRALLRDHWPAVLRVALAALASTVSTIFAV